MDNTESNIEKCPVMHGSMTKNTTSGTSNKIGGQTN